LIEVKGLSANRYHIGTREFCFVSHLPPSHRHGGGACLKKDIYFNDWMLGAIGDLLDRIGLVWAFLVSFLEISFERSPHGFSFGWRMFLFISLALAGSCCKSIKHFAVWSWSWGREMRLRLPCLCWIGSG
jgi:hypothetical protein